jgi:pyruvate dehydrogenase E2 component (dihydrolipoamide acetyltransferase)
MPSKPRPDQQEYDLEALSPVRRAIGERTATSFATKPHFSLATQADATALVALREQLRSQQLEPLPTYNDILIKVCAALLPKHRRLNAWLEAEGLKLLRRVNIAFTAATDQGVLLPVVLDADRKSLAEIAAETRELVRLARAGKLRASLQMGGGFLLSNIGPGRIEWLTAIISPPMVAVLAVGSLAQRPVVVDGEVVARPTLNATLTVDHQVLDGADAAAFLHDWLRVLEDPSELRAACGLQASF